MKHPITPPPELVEEWFMDQRGLSQASRQHIATQAAQWGADQELEACCEWTWQDSTAEDAASLRAARRPKPPSLKEQALTALSEADQGLNESEWQQRSDTIRRALEQLDDPA